MSAQTPPEGLPPRPASLINRIVAFALQQRMLMVLLALGLAAAGVWSYNILPMDAYPNLSPPMVDIVTQWPGHSAEEVERLITVPVELGMNAIPGMVTKRSVSLYGLSDVTLGFADGTDPYFARQRVRNRLPDVELPDGVSSSMSPMSPPSGLVYRYVLQSTDRSPMELKTLNDWVVAPQYRAVPGVADDSGFGGGTIHYPQGVAGPFAAVAVVPGYLAAESTIAWWGPRLASHGFVVITMATNNTLDLPASRSAQLTAALNQLKTLSATPGHAVFGLVDPNRLGVVGWSYGGGGTLLNAQANPQLKAAMALAPKTLLQGDFTGTTVPTLVVGCQADTTAAPAFWAIPFYNKVSASTGKAYLEVRGGSHFCVTSSTSDADKKALGKYGVAWLKRFMDEDTRYAPFLCGAPRQADVAGNAAISDYRDNCPY